MTYRIRRLIPYFRRRLLQHLQQFSIFRQLMSKIYFASDFHLGLDARLTSRQRELQIIRWLDVVSKDAEALYLVGDLFDFWFEYKSVVPKGHFRLLAKLADLIDDGIEISLFTGNHDMWMFDYLKDELGVPIYREPIIVEAQGKKLFVGHGDGLGPGDHGYKFIKKVFASPVSQWLFARLHPNFAFKVAQFWSGQSRTQAYRKDQWHGREGEWLISFCNDYLRNQHMDYFVFGHRHLPIVCNLQQGISRYINLGDWLSYNSYAVMEDGVINLTFFENEEGEIRYC